MRAVVVKENGGAENLHFSDIDVPAPGAGQVAIAVDTAGVNYLDIYQRNGAARAPFVAGVEGVGRVTEAGAGRRHHPGRASCRLAGRTGQLRRHRRRRCREGRRDPGRPQHR